MKCLTSLLVAFHVSSLIHRLPSRYITFALRCAHIIDTNSERKSGCVCFSLSFEEFSVPPFIRLFLKPPWKAIFFHMSSE